ncbi:hypothetical protein CDD82_2193 [Ophiocordyceps australis]|uniref:Uncharacterized protein n=1 Tax=Ophiocordyceps australis TaxID=1399860 RepID=A0A2C5ZIA2_9HYPO|nr:hypothetical protein CDD82_2193 [Ophiocordyceps australis]
MSTVQQGARSLRKTSARTAASSSEQSTRSSSPSRLPVKPRPSGQNSSHVSSLAAKRGSRVTSETSRPTWSNAATTAPTTAAPTRLSRLPPPTTASSSTRRPTSSSTRRPTSAIGVPTSQARQAQGHVRAKSTATALNSPTTLQPLLATGRFLGQRSVSLAVARPPASTRPPPPLGKAGSKAQPLAIAAPPSPSKHAASIAETTRLQAELLQLHLFHRNAAAVNAQWQASAKATLGGRFAQLSNANNAIAQQQRDAMEHGNIMALWRWGTWGQPLDTKIQALDDVVAGIWTLTASSGRLARTVKSFDHWLQGVGCIQEARGSNKMRQLLRNHQALFVSELDAPWKEECVSMLRLLEGWRAQLREIDHTTQAHEPRAHEPHHGTSPQGRASTLHRMLATVRQLLDGTLAELRAMQEIERRALAREDAWLESTNHAQQGGQDKQKAGAIWRVL